MYHILKLSLVLLCNVDGRAVQAPDNIWLCPCPTDKQVNSACARQVGAIKYTID